MEDHEFLQSKDFLEKPRPYTFHMGSRLSLKIKNKNIHVLKLKFQLKVESISFQYYLAKKSQISQKLSPNSCYVILTHEIHVKEILAKQPSERGSCWCI